MKTMARAATAALSVSLAACGAPDMDERQDHGAGAPDAPDGVTATHAEDIGSAGPGVQVRVRNCTYVATTTAVGIPPRFELLLSRLATPGCPAESVVIDASYSTETVLTAVKGGQGIALAYSYKATPSGAGLTHVHVFAVAPETMAVTRTAFLGEVNASTAADKLFFAGQTLVVKGERHLVMGGGVDEYTAYFPDFLTSGAPPTVVDSP